MTAISFGFTLASAPTPVVLSVGDSPTAECPGSVDLPEAAAGTFCIYEGAASNVGSFVVTPASGSPAGSASRFGALLALTAQSILSRAYVHGSWAVTAS
jgi:hypothetical protein